MLQTPARRPPPVRLGRLGVQGASWRGSVHFLAGSATGAVHTSLVLLPEQPLELQVPREDENYGGKHIVTQETGKCRLSFQREDLEVHF